MVLIAESRSKSEDPLQEALRTSKDKWNAEMKALIYHLIAIKRSINGRGDHSLGIPPSNIKDPLPPETSSMLERISAEYENVARSALDIINEQASYSENRKKPTMANLNNDEIEKLAQNWFSKVKTFFQVGDDTKVIRRDLLNIFIDMKKKSREIEDFILSNDPNNINEAISKYDELLRIFQIRFIKIYNHFLKQQEMKPTQEAGGELPNESRPETSITEDVKNIPAEKPQVEKKQTEQDPSYDRSIIKKLNLDAGRPGYIDHFLSYKIMPSEKDRQWIKNTSRILDRTYSIIQKLDENDNSYREKFDSYKQYYNLLLEFIKSKTGISGNSFAEISKFVVASIKDLEIQKLAGNNLTRWLKRKFLEISWTSNQVRQIRLDMAKKLEECIDLLNKMIKIVEKKDLQPESLISEVVEMSSLFKETSEIIYNLGQIHNDAAHLESARNLGKKNKKDILQIIPERTLNRIKRPIEGLIETDSK